jgi:hypothetical protein
LGRETSIAAYRPGLRDVGSAGFAASRTAPGARVPLLQRAARFRSLVDFVIGRAVHHPRVKEAIVELFAELETLGQLTHVSYLWKLLFM